MAPNRTEDLPNIEGEGVSVKRIKKLDDAIDEWNSIKTKRMNLTEKEVEARTVVLDIMHAQEITAYKYDDDHRVVIKDGLKVERIKAAAANGKED